MKSHLCTAQSEIIFRDLVPQARAMSRERTTGTAGARKHLVTRMWQWHKCQITSTHYCRLKVKAISLCLCLLLGG